LKYGRERGSETDFGGSDPGGYSQPGLLEALRSKFEDDLLSGQLMLVHVLGDVQLDSSGHHLVSSPVDGEEKPSRG
jgi:hypothetical protein